MVHQEEERYKSEGISIDKIEYQNNDKLIDLIDKGGHSIMSILDEETLHSNQTDRNLQERFE